MDNNTSEQDPLLYRSTKHGTKLNPSTRTALCVILLIGGALLVVSIVFAVESLKRGKTSRSGVYSQYVVAADAGPCSTVGRLIIEQENGSAVDAAIATTFCVGVHNAHSTGIGGGLFMVIYDIPRGGSTKELYTIDGREVAPAASTPHMLLNITDKQRGLKAGVPGTVAGLYQAWLRFGKVPWARLVEPTIKMCRDGFIVGETLAIYLKDYIKDPGLMSIYRKPDGTYYKSGETITQPKLADTLDSIANEGPNAFYGGRLSSYIGEEIQKCGGIITRQDLANYTSTGKQPLITNIEEKGWRLISNRPPSSAAALHLILKIMNGYEYNAETDKAIMYHRLVEAMKFAEAQKTRLADEEFVNVNDVLVNMTSNHFATALRNKITDRWTHNTSYYEPLYRRVEDSGTSHVSVLGPGGSAVAVTSSINDPFGCLCAGEQTGIIYNNEMTDFDSPGERVSENLAPSGINFIQPGKRPLSSMSPTIILDGNGSVIHITGASGGSKIIPVVASVAIQTLFWGTDLQEAVDEPRLRHALLPDEIDFEEDFPKTILDDLVSRGHRLDSSNSLGVVQAINNRCRDKDFETCWEAVSDHRKGGQPSPDGK